MSPVSQPAVPEPPKRGRGRPPKHGEPLADLRVRLPESLLDDLRHTAAEAGHSLNDQIIDRLRRTTTKEQQ